jgi:Mg/Co/Ni transporter MgtE
MEAGADRDLLASAKSGSGDTPFVTIAEEPQEEFSERVKSLLNLDEEDLTPIASQMTQQELVKIYQTSSNLQREKLLRSLTPERAAKLMQEIML